MGIKEVLDQMQTPYSHNISDSVLNHKLGRDAKHSSFHVNHYFSNPLLAYNLLGNFLVFDPTIKDNNVTSNNLIIVLKFSLHCQDIDYAVI